MFSDEASFLRINLPRNLATWEAGFLALSIITIATTKGGAGKTTIGRLILARKSLEGFKVAAVDSDFNHTLTDWLSTAAKKYAIPVRHELDETRIVPLITELDQQHDVVIVDTAGGPTTATNFPIRCADLALSPPQPSSADAAAPVTTVQPSPQA